MTRSTRRLIALLELCAVVCCAFTANSLPNNDTRRGAVLFAKSFTPDQGLGPLFNKTSCSSCHIQPSIGGMGPDGLAPVTRVGRITPSGFDDLEDDGGPVMRTRSVVEFGYPCDLHPTSPSEANVFSVRNAPSLYGDGLIDLIPDTEIISGAVPRGDGVEGRVNFVVNSDGRSGVGRFGWKADTARLKQFIAEAFRNELGITSPIVPKDSIPVAEQPRNRCAGESLRAEADRSTIDAVAAFVASLAPPRVAEAPNARVFQQIGCEACHVPSLKLNGGAPVWLYSDLLLHDLGGDLNDSFTQGSARGNDWRTTPLWGLSLRRRYLHDGRALSFQDAIVAHGGEALRARTRFLALTPRDRNDLLAYLKTL
jgi:CxxC motif-containing protein (DUF1111 family)